MGCINQKASFAKRPAQNSSEFLTDSEIQPGVFKPLSTTLFNLFRKPNEIQIIRNASSTKKLFFKEQSPNLTVLTTKDIKMLYNFKNILIVGTYQPFIDRLKAEAQPKMIYSISEQQASEFLEQFPTYRVGEPVQQAKLIPIFVLSSKQIKKKGIQKNIFLHSSQNQNKKLYQKLQLGTLLYDFPDKNPHQMAELFHSCQAKNVLFLHSKNRKQDQLLEILSLYASSQYKVDLLSAQIYIRRCLPHTSINTQKFLQPSQPTHKQIPVGPKQQLSTTQRLQLLLKNLQKQQDSKQQKHEGNLSKTSRSYNLLLTLVNNICSNKTNESYRTVRKNNGQIYELLGKYKSGIGLMKEIGFVEKSGNYVNVLEDKYLKILRVDLEMAYKNFIDAKNAV